MARIAGYIGKELVEQGRIRATLGLMSNCGSLKHFYTTITTDYGICVALLHSRSGISDYSVDPQPFTNAPTMEGYYTIVLDGEIYNYIELREQLRQKGVSSYRLQTELDVILQYYIKYGTECVNYFEGMWSFAIFDRKKERLFLSKDPFGTKPLYYSITPSGVFFGTKIKYIQSLANGIRTMNYQQLTRYLATGYVSLYVKNDTFFQGVKGLPPATNLVIDKRLNARFSQHWFPSYSPKSMSLQEAVEGFRHHLLHAVKTRLPANIPLASHLAGGPDSAAITSIAAKVFNRDVKSFSMIIPDKRYDEYSNIRATIDDLGCDHSIIYMSQEKDFSKLTELIQQNDAPVTTIAYYLLSLLNRAIAEQGFKVALAGHGLEAQLGGNFDHISYYLYEMRHSPSYPQYRKEWEQHIQPLLYNPSLIDIDGFFRQIEAGERTSDLDNFTELLSVNFVSDPEEKSYAGSPLRNKMRDKPGGGLRTAMHEEASSSLLYSMEIRSPFLDARLYDFSFSIPNEYLVQEGYGKYILRKAMEGILNEQVRTDRQKVGFNAPFDLWADLSCKNIRDYLLEDGAVFDLVDRKKVEALLKHPLSERHSKFMFYFLSSKIFMESQGG